MSRFVVITFDDPNEAHQAREALHEVEKRGLLSLDDSATIVRDAEGKIHVHNQTDRGVKIGAVTGGFLGLLLAGIFFPIGGLIIGAAAGGLIGKSVGLGIDKKFVKDVVDSLQPNSSALMLIVRSAQPDVAIAALKPFKGHVYQTSLEPETEEALRRALGDPTASATGMPAMPSWPVDPAAPSEPSQPAAPAQPS
jgi:uncharacterized membrane protein